LFLIPVSALAATFIAALTLVSSPSPALAAPANDNFANAVPIVAPAVSGIVATGTNTGATPEPGEPLTLPACASTSATVWYTWTSPSTPGSLALNMKGSGYDTRLAVFTGSAVNSLSMVACNDDFQGLRSVLSFSYVADTTYAIQVGGFGSDSGDFVLSLSTGATMILNSNLDNTTSDTVLTLREAMLLARGGTDPQGLGRALSAGEASLVLNAPNVGASGSDLIHFREGTFPLGGSTTIGITSVLPDLSASGDTVSGIGAGVIVDPTTTIDCFQTSGSSNHIEGLQINSCDDGITISGLNNVVGGSLSIQRNVIGPAGMGIVMINADGTVIQGNYIGLNAAGTAALPVNQGVWVTGSDNVLIGGSAPGEGNVISGATAGPNNRGISNTDSHFTQIIGNKIGSNAAGTAPLPNGRGIAVEQGIVPSQGVIIGGVGPGEANLIAFNNQEGVLIAGSSTSAAGTQRRGGRTRGWASVRQLQR
jgi:hypothetical protein